MCDFHKEAFKCRLKGQSIEQALEKLRVGLIFSMRIGCTFVINVDKMAIDFKNTFTH